MNNLKNHAHGKCFSTILPNKNRFKTKIRRYLTFWNDYCSFILLVVRRFYAMKVRNITDFPYIGKDFKASSSQGDNATVTKSAESLNSCLDTHVSASDREVGLTEANGRKTTLLYRYFNRPLVLEDTYNETRFISPVIFPTSVDHTRVTFRFDESL